MPDVDPADVVSHIDHEAVPVSANVEYHLSFAQEVSGRKVIPYVEVLAVTLPAHKPNPLPQRLAASSMFASEVRQARPGDDVHVRRRNSKALRAVMFPIWWRRSAFFVRVPATDANATTQSDIRTV